MRSKIRSDTASRAALARNLGDSLGSDLSALFALSQNSRFLMRYRAFQAYGQHQ